MVGFENESRDDSTSSTFGLADGCAGDGARRFTEELGASGCASLAQMLSPGRRLKQVVLSVILLNQEMFHLEDLWKNLEH